MIVGRDVVGRAAAETLVWKSSLSGLCQSQLAASDQLTTAPRASGSCPSHGLSASARRSSNARSGLLSTLQKSRYSTVTTSPKRPRSWIKTYNLHYTLGPPKSLGVTQNQRLLPFQPLYFGRLESSESFEHEQKIKVDTDDETEAHDPFDETHASGRKWNSFFEKNDSPGRILATLDTDADGKKRMRLRIPSQTELGSGVVTLDVVCASSQSASVQHRLAREITLKKSRREKERLMRGKADWVKIMLQMDMATPSQKGRQSRTRFDGPANHINMLYHKLLNSSDFSVDPETPRITWNNASMRVKGSENTIKRLNSMSFPGVSTVSDIDEAEAEEREWKEPLSYPPPSSGSVQVRCASPTRFAREIPIPTRWTFDTLLRYVKDIAASRRRRSMRFALGINNSENKDHALLLKDVLLHNSEARDALSYAAFHRAISHLAEIGQLRTAREIAGAMESRGFACNTHTYNIFLHGCGRDQNVAAFGHIQNTMLRAGVIPNTQSWVALLNVAPTVRAKQVITRRMAEKSMDPAKAYSLNHTPSFVPFSFIPYLENNAGSILDYVNVITSLFGPNWFSEASMRFLVGILAKGGDFPSCVALIDLYCSRNGRLQRESMLHILLGTVVHQGNHCSAVWLCVYALQHWNEKLSSPILYWLMFKIALKWRSYNMARVAWKYAAATGDLTHEMRWQAIKSLRACFRERGLEAAYDYHTDPPAETATYTEKWKASFGAVICDKSPTEIRTLGVEKVLQLERQLWHKEKPPKDFVAVLGEALLLDAQWYKDGTARRETTRWKVENAIKIQLRPRPMDEWYIEPEKDYSGADD